MADRIASVVPDRAGVDPAVTADVTLDTPPGTAPITVAGSLWCAGRRLAHASAASFGTNPLELRGPTVAQNQAEGGELRATVTFDLSRAAVDFLDDAHGKGTGDLHLELRLELRMLVPSWGVTRFSQGSNVDQAGASQYVISRQDDRGVRPFDVVTYARPHGAVLARVHTEARQLRHVVPSSDWARIFAPALGLGKFTVFEIPDPPALDPAAALAEPIKIALEDMGRVRQSLVEGNWEKACDDLRAISEILKSRTVASQVDAALAAQGYQAEALQNVRDAMKAHFALASKFHHRLGQGQTPAVHAEIKPSREEAYFMCMSVFSLLNLIARKAARQP